MATTTNQLRVGILGASGYTGAELVRLLARHPQVEIRLLTADRQAGKPLGEVFPHLGHLPLPALVKIEDVDWSGLDLVFCALPHGTTQEVIARLPRQLKIVDLSADFRLADVGIYAEWYGHAHQAPDLQREAVYGLTELKRKEIAPARLVANPGCYPTSAQLPLVPLIEAGQIEAGDIIIDAKSGVSGAGRDAKQASLYAEVTEGIHAYSIASHRHAPEIEQGLSEAAGRPITVNFTPHLMPMSRGILSSIYVRLANGTKVEHLRQTLDARYRGEPFVRVLPSGQSPATRHVRGSNHCLIGLFADRVPGRAILISVIDNLVKGASGQAVQNMNLMAGLPETAGLEQEPLFSVSGHILSLRNFRPRIADDVYVAPTAAVIGDVEIGFTSGIWFGCTLRADGNVIRIGARTNIQDGTVIHVNSQPDGGRGAHGYACLIGSGVTVGHMALLHACTLEDGSFVGMKACVMDGAMVETDGMVAAGALVTPGKRVKRGELWAGSPAKLMRALTPAELELFKWTAQHYVERAQLYRSSAVG